MVIHTEGAIDEKGVVSLEIEGAVGVGDKQVVIGKGWGGKWQYAKAKQSGKLLPGEKPITARFHDPPRVLSVVQAVNERLLNLLWLTLYELMYLTNFAINPISVVNFPCASVTSSSAPATTGLVQSGSILVH
ncbi:hypothetical protein ACNKU7_07205 [Microbulbifer sp. SA54]|uniref:hypothetical protein n=1 Tax=Microbulbifer sp. SA54 TaxID=3401577 RepID=UPI003AACF2EB